MDTDFFTDQEKLKPLAPSDLKKLVEQRSAVRGHERQQHLLDALTSIAVTAIFVVPSVLAALFAGVLIHKAWIGEWSALEDTLKSMLIPVTTYLAGLLSKNVLNRNGS